MAHKKRGNDKERKAIDKLRHEFAEDLGLPGDANDQQMINRFTQEHGENLQGNVPSDQARRITPSFNDHKRDRQKVKRNKER